MPPPEKTEDELRAEEIEAIKDESEKEFWLEHKLIKPLMPFGEEMTVLKLRFPTTPEIRKLNDPFHSRAGGGTVMDSDLAAKWIEKLGKLPNNGCDAMHWRDFQIVKGEVVSFFGDSLDAST